MNSNTDERLPWGRCGRPRRDGRPCRNPVPPDGSVCSVHAKGNLPVVRVSTVRAAVRDLLRREFGAELSPRGTTDYYKVRPVPALPGLRFIVEVTIHGPVTTLVTLEHPWDSLRPRGDGKWLSEHISPYGLDWARHTGRATPLPGGGYVANLYVLTPYVVVMLRQWLREEREGYISRAREEYGEAIAPVVEAVTR